MFDIVGQIRVPAAAPVRGRVPFAPGLQRIAAIEQGDEFPTPSSLSGAGKC
jgi:hypothetical protein